MQWAYIVLGQMRDFDLSLVESYCPGVQSLSCLKNWKMDKEINPISESLKEFVLQKCRHEFGHYVIARAQGFRTGAVNFALMALDGGHEGSSEIMLHTPLLDADAISRYLERRIVVLYAGAMAEGTSAQDLNGDYVDEVLRSGGGDNDLGKIEELVELHLNISQPNVMTDEARVQARQQLKHFLRKRSACMVRAEYGLIEELATILAEPITKVRCGSRLEASVIDAMPSIKKRFLISQ